MCYGCIISAIIRDMEIKLKKLREAAGLTQEQLHRLSGVARANISNLERGETSRVDINTLERLCRALSCTPGDLLELAEEGEAGK